MHNRLLVRISNIAEAIQSEENDTEDVDIDIDDLSQSDWENIRELVQETEQIREQEQVEGGQPNKKQKKTRTKYWKQRCKRLFQKMLNEKTIEEEEVADKIGLEDFSLEMLVNLNISEEFSKLPEDFKKDVTVGVTQGELKRGQLQKMQYLLIAKECIEKAKNLNYIGPYCFRLGLSNWLQTHSKTSSANYASLLPTGTFHYTINV
jgi:hypothetical protein